MKFLITVLLCSLCVHAAIIAQQIQTIIPPDPVITGTAFQVQYIITDPFGLATATPPAFDSMQLISGPHNYKGTAFINGKLQPIENITYTLVPLVKGKIKLKGITVQFKNGNLQKSNDVFVEVISPPKASYNARSNFTDVRLYTSKPGQESNKIIPGNLFIKTETSKVNVYQGEPIEVTFKLYSALQSSSEAIKAPGLYGFDMVDMIDINEAHIRVEKLRGKIFNTAILRQMQLYPAQAGHLIIDPIHVNNTIEFYDSLHPGQKISIEKELASEKIPVLVHPLPSGQPDNYTGAVGDFKISARLQAHTFPANKQGKLAITISGRGNFIQFAMPLLKPVAGIYFSEPAVTDRIDKKSIPLKGERTYEVSVTGENSGIYVLPPLQFSYFDITDKEYKTIETDSLTFKITTPDIPKHRFSGVSEKGRGFWWLVLSGLLAAAAIIIIKVRALRKQKNNIPETGVADDDISLSRMVEELHADGQTNKEIYSGMQRILSSYLNENKNSLTLGETGELNELINEYQLLIYSGIGTADKTEQLKKRSMDILGRI